MMNYCYNRNRDIVIAYESFKFQIDETFRDANIIIHFCSTA